MSRAWAPLVGLALAAGACGWVHVVPDRYYVVEPDVADGLARRPGTLVLDVRPPADFEAGHIPGAMNIPVNELWRRADELPPEQGRIIVVYDSEPRRALRAGTLLRSEGYYRVHVVHGQW